MGSGGTYHGSPSTGSIAGWFALALTNASTLPIHKLAISFKGEQWRNGGNTTAQTLVLQQGYGLRFEDVSLWSAPGGPFNWSSPVATATAAAVDGNSAGLVSGRGGELDLATTPWAPGATLWLRWLETNDAGNDHGLAIDDLTIQVVSAPVIPEIAITAIDWQASEFGDGGTLRIRRAGPTTTDLVVALSLVAGSGLATRDDLLAPVPATLTIPAGSDSLDLPIRILDDNLDEGV